MYDLIGDIHGYAQKLEELLKKLGYSKQNGIYSHPERKALFVGDYIDRGPQIRETLQIVRSMTESGNAVALMGNHEYNALCFHFQNPAGVHLRNHLIKNVVQHYETLRQFQNRQDEYEDYIEWFLSLPLYYETDDFRVVHACWEKENIDYLRKTLVNDRLTKELVYESAKPGTKLFDVIDETLKGKEIALPGDLSFFDKDGTKRKEFRIKWWENPAEMTYRSLSVEKIDQLPDTLVQLSELKSSDYYQADDKKMFFGHYWLKGRPQIYRENICCLDYSVAKGGNLVAYRLNSEEKLDNGNLAFV